MKPYTPPQGNVPYDVNAASLFDTAYIHPLVRDSFLPWWYYDRFAKWTTWLVSGTQAGLDQWVGEISPERFHASKIFFNKSTKAMPFISEQYRTSSLINTLRSYIAQVPLVKTGGKKIDLAPWPTSVDEKGVVKFLDNGRVEAERMRGAVCQPDMVILATGYRQTFPFLDKSYPMPTKADIRNIWKTGDESVGFIGFVRPSFGESFILDCHFQCASQAYTPIGAIPPLSELQAQLWILSLLSRSGISAPMALTLQTHYKLSPPPNARINYGVDHESYAYQLALDIGSAPSVTQLLTLPRQEPSSPSPSSNLKLLASWALSANINTKFRLIGPWKWDGARDVMENEIWKTVSRRRGFFGHFTLSFLPIAIFGTLSAVVWAVCWMWMVLKWVWKLLTLTEV